MAAIDKIYLNSYNEYALFRNWLYKQPKLKDKYGKEVSLMEYFFDYWDKESWFDKNGKSVTHLGTKVMATGRYVGEKYEFIVIK